MNRTLSYPGGSLDFKARPLVMGILNVTPDSFSDGGRYFDAGRAIAQGEKLAAQGADIIDIGGESSRPGSQPVGEEEEKRRVLPVIKRLSTQLKIPLSIDSYKPGVVAAAADAGARLINDISGLRAAAMRRLAAELELPVVIMHMRGRPRTMQKNPRYADVLRQVIDFLRQRISAAVQAGVSRQRIIVDPGIGFGKKLEHNLSLLRGISRLKKLGRPLLIGASRKSMISMIAGEDAKSRLAGSVAIACLAAEQGADILRVHDVAETVAALKVWQAVGSIKAVSSV